MSDKKPITNVHVHTFNVQYVPDNFIGQFLSFASKPLTRIMKVRWMGKLAIRMLMLLPRKNELRKYIAFLKVGIKESQYKIYHDLKNNEGYPKDTRFVVLPLNFKYMGAGKVRIPYEQQLSDLIQVKASDPECLLPFLYIDPRMGTSESNRDFVKKYIEEKGFVGLKMYPALGYYPYDPRLEKVFEYADEMELPIITHCSSTGVFYNDRKNIPNEFILSESFNPQKMDTINGGPRTYDFTFPPPGVGKKHHMARFADNFLQPVNYTDILDRFKKLKICFAHFGLDNDQYHNRIKLSWHKDIISLINSYGNAYTDISYSLHYEKVRKSFHTLMKQPRVKDKILYGTDFFMTLMEVSTERELYHKTLQSFGKDFEKIAHDNMKGFLSSKVYDYDQ